MSDMDIPVIVIIGCEKHATVGDGPVRVVVSGPDSTEATRIFMANILACWECWDRDELAILAITQALGLTPEVTVWLRRQVMRKKLEQNRN